MTPESWIPGQRFPSSQISLLLEELKKMRPTTRRVTAQRKFAQGAYVPPGAAAAPGAGGAVPNAGAGAAFAPAERRDVPPPNPERNNIFRSIVTVEQLLDMVCFTNSHNHIQPIVLVERLRNGSIAERETSTIEPVRRPAKRRRRRRRSGCVQKRIHPMSLRSSALRLSRIRYSPPPTSRALIRKLPRTKPPPALAITRAKRRCTTRARKFKVDSTASEYSLDDNRPLKYFAKSNAPNSAEQEPEPISFSMPPPLLIPRPTYRQPQTADLVVVLDPANESTSSIARVIENDRALQDHADIDRVRLPEITAVQRYFEELEPGPSGLCNPPQAKTQFKKQSKKQSKIKPRKQLQPLTTTYMETTSDSLTTSTEQPTLPGSSYYSTQAIQLWMDKSREPSSTHCAQLPLNPDMEPSSSDDGEISTECVGSGEDGCHARTWITLKEVVDAPKHLFDSRCTKCKHCLRIEKVKKLSKLLKRQMRIDCREYDANENEDCESVCAERCQSRARDESGKLVSTNGNQHLYLELIPKSKHLMTKVKIHTVLDKQVFSSCFVPRSKANDSNNLIMSKHEHLLDQLIETLSLSLGDPPANIVDKPKSNAPTISSEPIAVGESPSPNLRKEKELDTDEPAEPSQPNLRRNDSKVKIAEAPVLYPTKEEFKDPFAYIKKIVHLVKDYGICKIVPPEGFIPPCKGDDDCRFEVTDQHITRLYSRWGVAARQLCAIKECLKAQNTNFARMPLLEGVVVNLPRLYQLVHNHGGLETVINKKRWGKVAEDMNLAKNPFTERKLDRIYTKYLLPYAALSDEERQGYLQKVEKSWTRKYRKLLERAHNPLHRKKRLLGESDSSAEESEEDVTDEAEDCVRAGANMNLGKFKKIARSVFNSFFRDKTVATRQIEEEYWRTMLTGTDSVTVHSASVDTSEQGLGFPTSEEDSYSKHPWNLKMLSKNPANVLRAMGPVLGVTVPTLHLGMLYSTSCWHRDPHAISWVEFLHSGPVKVWYGIPEKEDMNFRKATQLLNPTAAQNKQLWLSSDIAMIPPYLLREKNVNMYKVEQNPGEFVLVMPRAYSCSINTGFTVSESTYIATESWLENMLTVFNEIRESCEPTMFSIEQLLKGIAEDHTSSKSILEKIFPALDHVFRSEVNNRLLLKELGVKETYAPNEPIEPQPSTSKEKGPPPVWNVRDQDECEVCRCTLYLTKVKNIPARNSMVCLEHAIKLLQSGQCKQPISDIEMQSAFFSDDLLSLITYTFQRMEMAEATEYVIPAEYGNDYDDDD